MQKFPWVGIIEHLPIYPGKLKLVIRDREQFDTYINRTFKEGDKVWVTVELPHKDRTWEQFKYLYSCVYALMAEDLGIATLEEMDGIMKKRLLTVNKDTPLEYVKNKTDLNRAELAEYIDGVRREAAGMGISTADPT
ncbi:hypothetical protein LCGC14_1408820 [marine sediment metagenome]|uniref:Uncharacterized protein n=1 Tax=marine sediment metagenome TaxID=412755 RepID=A0A0F9MWH7_9ZZZZ